MPPARCRTRALTASIFAAALQMLSCADDVRPQRAVPPAKPLGPRTVEPASGPVLDAASVLDRTRAFVVAVECLDRKHNVVAQGSGVIVANNTVVTSWPLVSKAFSLRVRRGDDMRPARIDAVLETAGLARIAVEASGAIDLGRDTYPSSGSTVFIVGSAQGFEVSALEGVASGMREARGDNADLIETAVSASAGLVGGALVEEHGELIGILGAARAGDAHSLAVPVRYVKDLLALPAGALPKVTSSPLQRLPGADRQWLLSYMAAVARDQKPLAGLGLDRVNALLDRIEPLVGADLAWVKVELGLGWLSRQRLLYEDGVEARTFRRVSRSHRRAEVEQSLLGMGVLTPRDLSEADAMIRAIAAHDEFEIPGGRVDGDERWLTQMLGKTDQTKRRIETALWEARSR